MFETVSAPSAGWDAARVEGLVGVLATLGRGAPDGPDDGELLAQLTALEHLKAAAAGAQARVTAVFAASQDRAARTARETARGQGFEVWQAVRDRFRGSHGVPAQVALARAISPHQGARAVSFAQRLATDLPVTAAHLAAGRLSERRAMIVARETSHLAATDCVAVDQQVCGDRDTVASYSDREFESAVRAATYRRDPQGAVERARTAETERRVSIRPLPDVMCRVSALLPMVQGIAAYAALSRDADSARAGGDARTRGQLMCDLLVQRVTGQQSASAVPVEVQVVISDTALLGTGGAARQDPAVLPGYGAVPAGWVRDLISSIPPKGADKDTTVARLFLRRLYATPDGAELVAMESTRRLFPPGLRRFLATRDGTCRTPWCDAPIRHTDHVRDHDSGGTTSAGNGQALCERCNHTKQFPGWDVSVVGVRAGPHTVRWRTPTGTTYDSTAPPLLPAATARPEASVLEAALLSLLAA